MPGVWEHGARYEALRNLAINHQARVARHGLAVLLRQGIAAWMEAWSTMPGPSPPRSAPGESPRSFPLPDGASVEVVRVLAAMALGHRQEVHG